jgi:prophage maintenance system killer protein
MRQNSSFSLFCLKNLALSILTKLEKWHVLMDGFKRPSFRLGTVFLALMPLPFKTG